MPSLRSSIRKRLEAEEAEQQADNPVEQNQENSVEAAAQEAIQAKLDEQPEPVVEPRMQVEEDDTEDYTDEVNQLNLRLADAQAQVAGHKFGSREYVDAIANNLRQEDSPRRERTPSMMAPVSRSTPSWSSGRSTPSKTELTGDEVAFCREQNLDLEEYRRNKAKMQQMKAAGVIQE